MEEQKEPTGYIKTIVVVYNLDKFFLTCQELSARMPQGSLHLDTVDHTTSLVHFAQYSSLDLVA